MAIQNIWKIKRNRKTTCLRVTNSTKRTKSRSVQTILCVFFLFKKAPKIHSVINVLLDFARLDTKELDKETLALGAKRHTGQRVEQKVARERRVEESLK